MKRFFTLLTLLLLAGGLAAQVSSQQIGSASNAYSTYISGGHALSFLPGVGTNGGSLSFVHRENTSLHTGGSSGEIRFATSKDGGSTWRTEQGPITVRSTRPSRYPTALLFNPDSANTDTNLVKLVSACPTLNATGTGFDGQVQMLVDSALTTNYIVTQEDYAYQAGGTNANSRLPRSLVERVENEFIYVTQAPNARDVWVYKGVFDSTSRTVTWTIPHMINVGYRTGAPQGQSYHVSFSPDGQTGFISLIGDITGGQDMTFNPILIKTTDGGATWGTPDEVDLTQWYRLIDTLTSVTGASGLPVLGSRYPVGSNVIPMVADLTVDANGNPHFFALVGNEVSLRSPNYDMAEDKYLLVDITQDTAGNWEGIYVGPKYTRRATIGNTAVTSGSLIFESWLQVTRSQDGTKIFYSWNDTDTTSVDWSPGDGNDNPDLFGRAIDLTTGLMTPIRSWTRNDTMWNGRILTPIVTNTVKEQAGNYTVPTMAMRLTSNTTSLLSPVSYWYFSNITYPGNTFTQTPTYFRTYCGDNPLSAQISGRDDICGNNSGFVKVDITSSSPAPFSYRWNNGARLDSVGNLSAGTYSVVVSDDSSCTQSLQITIADIPGAGIDSVSSTMVSCNGGNDGMAFASVSGGTQPYSLFWINGDTTFTASNLAAGAYQFTVTDANGCTADTSVVVTEPTAVTVVTSSAMTRCFGSSDGSAGAIAGGGTPGYSYLWSNGDTGANTTNSLSAGSYTVTVTDANGCITTGTANVTEPPAINLTTTSFDADCAGSPTGSISLAVNGGTPGYFYAWSNGITTQTLGNVGAGSYDVTVTDANGCTSSTSAVVNEPDPISASVTIADVSCNGANDGSVDLSVSGGTPNYTFNWTNGAATQNLTGLPGGVYAVTIFDQNNCTGTALARVEEPPAITVNLSATPDNGTGNGTINAMANGGNPPFTYSWNNGLTGPMLTGLFSGNYILTLTDANNCSVVDTIFVGSNVGIADDLAAGIQSFRIFPNPNGGNFHLKVDLQKAQGLQLRMFNLKGQVVWSHRSDRSLRHHLQVNLPQLARGLYQIEVQTESGRSSKKVIVK